jgi:hypothetical protein
MVTPVLVTRGDVPMEEVIASVALVGSACVWNNAQEPQDMGIWGQYRAAMERVTSPWVYFQDDDVITEPHNIVALRAPGVVVCNVPQEHRPKLEGQLDTLMGFGSVFERRLIGETFGRYFRHFPEDEVCRREAPRIFTALNKTQWVDVPKRDLPWATAPNRMYHQPNHGKMRDEARRRCAFVLSMEAKGA